MKKYIFLASAVVALAACSSNEEFEQIGNCEIKLSSTLLVQTRAAQNIQSEAFESGESMAVFINEDSSSPSTHYDQPLQYDVEDDGSLTTTNPQYFPQNGNGVNIYAVYPYEAGQNLEVTETTAPFSVQFDQSSKDNYKASDLMVGETTSKPVYRTTDNVTLQFKHCLSKININIKVGDGVDANDLNDAIVTIYTRTNEATFDVQSGVITAVNSQAQASTPFVRAGNLTASGNGFEGMSAIIIPQDISAGSQFITIDTNNQTTYRYSLPNTVNLISFESGKAYTYNLTVRKSGLTLDSTNITDWDDGGSVDGDAFQS
ncbi:MAG: fimbrillin family protein [Prevotella sp.]|nr:fimbrillin family protein [Prevotella sp.]